jgi:hypothetical protein
MKERLVDGTLVSEWADCIVPGCVNKRCAALRSDKCYPHTNGLDPDLMAQLHGIVEQVKVEEKV